MSAPKRPGRVDRALGWMSVVLAVVGLVVWLVDSIATGDWHWPDDGIAVWIALSIAFFTLAKNAVLEARVKAVDEYEATRERLQ